MSRILDFAVALIYFLKFSLQEKLTTKWKVNRNEWMLLEPNKARPELFDACPKKHPFCKWCYKFTDYNTNEAFKPVFENRGNEKKYFCFYKIKDPADLKKTENPPYVSEPYDKTKHLLFTERDICDSFCIQSQGKKCAEIKKGHVLWVFKKHKFYCPMKSTQSSTSTPNTLATGSLSSSRGSSLAIHK